MKKTLPQFEDGGALPRWSLQSLGQLNNREEALLRAHSALLAVRRSEAFFRCLDDDQMAKVRGACDDVAAMVVEVRELRELVYLHRLEAEPQK